MGQFFKGRNGISINISNWRVKVDILSFRTDEISRFCLPSAGFTVVKLRCMFFATVKYRLRL